MLVISLCWVFKEKSLLAQSLERSVISGLGASSEVGDLQLDYTVGEAVVAPLESPAIVLSQGFHQVYRTITGLQEPPADLTLHTYPNPFESELEILIKGQRLDFNVQMYDATGQTLTTYGRQVKTSGQWQERLDFGQQPSGTYLLLITGPPGTWMKSFKIIKQ